MMQTGERSASLAEGRTSQQDLAFAFRLHGHTLLRRATKLTGRYDEAWDLLQEVFLRALDPGPRNLPADKICCWLLVVMGNLHIDHCRRAHRRRDVPFEESTLGGLSPLDETEQPTWRALEYDQVASCLSDLNPVLRDAYVLHDEQGLSLAATAERMRVPISTAGTRVFRARRQLRILLQQGRSLAPREASR